MGVINEYLNLSLEDIDLNSINLSLNDFKFITKDIMKKYCMLPIDIEGELAYVAMGNPEDSDAIEKISSLIGKKLCVVTSSREQIHSLINTMEEIRNMGFVLEQLKRQESINLEKAVSSTQIDISLDSSPVIKISDAIIVQAINKRASDIHIEPFEDIVIIRYRVDGVLYEHLDVPKSLYLSICSRIKIEAGMDIGEKRLPQDGKIKFKHKNSNYDLRVSTLPTIYGEKLVIRILYKEGMLMSLSSLGFNDRGIKLIKECLSSGHGIILVTGPTGSGKTTTLYSMLNEIDSWHKNIVAIEDPAEVYLKRINQVNVNTKSGLTFASGLRSVLRQDPDVIMVGEIRDADTAQIAVRAAITGHLVLSTLHTNDAVSSITRLVDMGVPYYLVADSLIACIAQRLVRKICEFCKIQYSPSEAERERLGINEGTVLHKGKGCIFCNNTGYKHRTVVYELMQISNSMRNFIGKEKSAEEIRNFNRKNRMLTIEENGRELVIAGITTYDEFLRLIACGS